MQPVCILFLFTIQIINENTQIMKKLILCAAVLLGAFLGTQPAQAQDWGRLLGAGAKVLQAGTISDDALAQYISQYVHKLDSANTVCAANDPYAIRLDSITKGLKSVDGIPLNFKVYKTNDVNAFACADGSVRVYSGLMDIMTDDQVLGVIGHELGHVAHHDTKKAFKQALINSALRDGIAGAAGGIVATLTDSQLGDLADKMMSAKYSRKQESQADDYGYDFLKANGRNPWAMAMAFVGMEKIENASPQASSFVNNLFSDHPELTKRIDNMSKRATKDGYTMPAAGTPGNDGSEFLHPKKTTTAKSTTAKKTTTKKTTTKKKTTSKKRK